MMASDFNPRLWRQRQVDLFDFKISLVHKVLRQLELHREDSLSQNKVEKKRGPVVVAHAFNPSAG